MANSKGLARPVGRWANKASIRRSVKRSVKESIAKDKRYGAATTDNNNSGKGLTVYKDKNGTAVQARKDGKGLRAYIPRKRKPKVAFPKGRSNG